MRSGRFGGDSTVIVLSKIGVGPQRLYRGPDNIWLESEREGAATFYSAFFVGSSEPSSAASHDRVAIGLNLIP